MLIFGILLLIFLIGVYPFWDKKYTRKLQSSLDINDRIAYFKYVIVSEWAVTVLILLMVAVSSASFSQIGLAPPALNNFEFLGMLTGFIIGVSLLMFVLMKLPFCQKYQKAQTDTISYLASAGKKDRIYGILTAITAGICEEIIYRRIFFIFFHWNRSILKG